MSDIYPSIPDPQNTVESLAETVRALKMTVETLAGQRDGGRATRAFEQVDEPKNPRIGDTWVDKTDAGRVRLWNGTYWVDVSDSRFSVLEKSSANAKAMIKELSTVRITDTEAFAQKITELDAKFNNNEARIYDEMTVRSTAVDALAQRITSLTASVANSDYNSAASITQESIVRATQDDALASQITTLTATVNSNNNTLTAAIANEATARATADSAETTARLALTSTVNDHTSSITTLSSTTASINGALSASWSVQGNIDGATGGLRLTGMKKADGTGATYDLIIQANTKIYGNLVVTGTIDAPQLAFNSVSNSGYNASGGGSTSVSVTCRSGARVAVLCVYDGGQSGYAINVNGTLTAYVNGVSLGAQSIWSSVVSGTIVGSTNQFFPVFMTQPTTLLTIWYATSDGTHSFSVISSLGGTVRILVMELAR